MNITVCGAGYVGMAVSLLLSAKNNVTVYDIDEDRVRMLNEGKPTVKDPEAEKAMSEGINVKGTTVREEAYKDADLIILALPTNFDKTLTAFNTSIIEKELDAIRSRTSCPVVIKSTVPIGFTEKMNKKHKNVMFSPEFLREGHAFQEHDPNVYAAESTDFFSRMSAKYRGNSNVIYEICNEPNGSTTWGDIEDYANKVIPEIRKNDPNALILVGTPKYCQDFTGPMAEPLSYSNIMYTAHFYAGTHKGETRERIQGAIDSGLPIFISECNICDATGNGNLDLIQAVYWRKFIKDNNLSYIVWNLSNANESAALIKSSCRKTGNWGFFDYSASGKFAGIMFRC